LGPDDAGHVLAGPLDVDEVAQHALDARSTPSRTAEAIVLTW
jgi:hypothetical protein